VKVVPTEEKLNVFRQGAELVIEGSTKARSVFAGNIDRLADRPDELGPHIHLEYYTDHKFYAPEMMPVVVSVVSDPRLP
jgi:hypothetical protein